MKTDLPRPVQGAILAVLMLNMAPTSWADASSPDAEPHGNIERASFGQLPDGRDVDVYRITNGNGLEMRVINYGGIIVSLRTPDTQGEFADIVLGFDSLEKYLSDAYRKANPGFGALIGRYANRIAEGQFSLNGEAWQLTTNDGPHHLHGGEQGFDRVLWQAEPFDNDEGAGVVLAYTSEGGEEGYPGRLETQVTYTLTEADALVIDYHATTDRATPVNLTQHSYFNLEGEGTGTVLDHRLMIAADAFTPVDETLIPTGEIRPVAGTPFDFTEPTPIGERIDQANRQLEIGQGYDHNFVLKRQPSDEPELAARVWEPDSGRLLEVSTTEPGLQLYSGNGLAGNLTGKRGNAYEAHAGLALETQHFPDSPNQDTFPSTILEPGETWRSRTVFAFSAQETFAAGTD